MTGAEQPAARRQRAMAARSVELERMGPAETELVALLPSTEAATVLLLCELAAELTS